MNGLINLYTPRSGKGIHGNIYYSITLYPNLLVGGLNKVSICGLFIILKAFPIIKHIDIKP